MKTILIFFFGLLTAMIMQAQINDSLVAWYPFNGNANDESGNGHDGAMVKTRFTKDRCMESNKAMDFPYKGNSIALSNTGHHNISGGEFSVVLWFKRADYFGVIFGGPIITNCYFPDYDTGFYFDLGHYGTFDFVVNKSTVHAVRYLPDYAWHMLAVVADQHRLFLYLDGELMDSSDYAIPPVNNNDIRLGLIDDTDYYNGLLDDVRIFQRAVKQSELKGFYDEKPFPVTVFQHPVNRMFCLHDTITLTLGAAGSHPIHYQWQKEETDIPGNDHHVLSIPMAQASDSGGYRCVVSNSLDTSISQTANVQIVFPIITSIMGKTGVNVNETAVYSVPRHYGLFYSFYVTGGDAIDSTENSITVLWSVAGQGSVKMVETASWICSHDTLSMPVTVGPSGLGLVRATIIKTWPNPVSNRVTFNYILESEGMVGLSLFNTVGKEVETSFNACQQPGQHEVDMEIGDLPAGIYYYQLKTVRSVATGKIVKL
jgi:hypothetical protein